MANYRAIVSINFDDDDLNELAEYLGVDAGSLDPSDSVNGALDNLEFGSGWLEQLFADGRPTITRLSEGINVEVNEHYS